MFQLFFLDGNSHTRPPLHQTVGLAAVLDMAGDHMQASSLRQGDMEVDGLRNVMMSTDQGLYLGHDPPFVLGRTLLDHGLPYPDEVVFAQTRATAGAVAQVTAVMVTAVVAAVQPEAVAEIATEHPMVQNIMSLSSWSVVPWCENLPSLLGLLLQATECLPQNIHNQCIKIKKATEAMEQHLNEEQCPSGSIPCHFLRMVNCIF
jgi:hypothetical protein